MTDTVPADGKPKSMPAGGALRVAAVKSQAHWHGVAVMQRDWFLAQQAYTNPPRFVRNSERSLAWFCAHILHSIQSNQMLPASMSRYLGLPS